MKALKHVGVVAKADYPGTAKFFEHCRVIMIEKTPFGRVRDSDVGKIFDALDPHEVSVLKRGIRKLHNVHRIKRICDRLGIDLLAAIEILSEDER